MSNVPFSFTTLLPDPMQRHASAFFPSVPKKGNAVKGSKGGKSSRRSSISSSFPTVIVTPPQTMDEHGQLIEFLQAEDEEHHHSLFEPATKTRSSSSWFALEYDSLWRYLPIPSSSSSSPSPTPRSLRSLLHLPPSLYDSQLAWLTLYFFTNLGLTLYNKLVLVRFPFPYTLTALHALCGSIGGYVLVECEVFEPRKLSTRETVVLFAFSVLYTVNIAVSNLSLGLVTVPFHQVVRAATPIFVMGLSAVLFRKRFTTKKLISLLPVIAGVGFATFGDYYFTTWGLVLTLLGTVLAALKTVFTNVLQSPPPSFASTTRLTSPSEKHPTSNSSNSTLLSTSSPSLSSTRLQLHPLDLLTRMSPLAFIQCVLVAFLSGELERVRLYSAREMSKARAGALIANGVLAFALNVVSFTANKRVGPLSMTVAANVKQVLTILFAVSLFDLTITPVNGLGIALTLLGGAWYASVEYREKREARRTGQGRKLMPT